MNPLQIVLCGDSLWLYLMYEPSTHKNWQAHLLYHTLSPTLTLIHPLTHLHPPSHPYKTSHLLGLADPLTPPLSLTSLSFYHLLKHICLNKFTLPHLPHPLCHAR